MIELFLTVQLSQLPAGGLLTAPLSVEAVRPAADAEIDPAASVAEIQRVISERYVLPEKREMIVATLSEGLASGRYDTRNPTELANRLTADLARVSNDRHLYVLYDPPRSAQIRERRVTMPGEREKAQVRAENHGIRDLKVLYGNVRYMDYRAFRWIDGETEAALRNAFEFLGAGDAIIIDLRRAAGGNSAAVQYMIRHFLQPGTPLMAFSLGGEIVGRSEVAEGAPTATLAGKPLYVLTSGSTVSAGEEFVGHVAGYRLGEVVGVHTAGGAFNNDIMALGSGLILSVSIGRPVLAATGGDWEGVGIAPTLPAPIDDALQVAHAHALNRLAEEAEGDRRRRLQDFAAIARIDAENRRSARPLSDYVGRYGSYTIEVIDDRLQARLNKRLSSPLISLGGNRFAIEDGPELQFEFLEDQGRILAVSQQGADGAEVVRLDRQALAGD